MTTLTAELTELEGHEFAASVGVASDLRTLLEAIKAHQVFDRLQRLYDPSVTAEVVSRIYRLCMKSIDPKYANPWDIALTALLLLLRSKSQAMAYNAAARIRSAANLFWAPRLAAQIEHETNARGATASVTVSRFAVPWRTALRSEGYSFKAAQTACLLAVSESHHRDVYHTTFLVPQDATRARMVGSVELGEATKNDPGAVHVP